MLTRLLVGGESNVLCCSVIFLDNIETSGYILANCEIFYSNLSPLKKVILG